MAKRWKTDTAKLTASRQSDVYALVQSSGDTLDGFEATVRSFRSGGV